MCILIPMKKNKIHNSLITSVVVLLLNGVASTHGQTLTSFVDIYETIQDARDGQLPTFSRSVDFSIGGAKGIDLTGDFSFTPPSSVEVTGTADLPLGDVSAAFTLGFAGTRVNKVYLLLEGEVPIGTTGLYMYSLGGGVSGLTERYIQIDAEASAGNWPSRIFQLRGVRLP